MSFIQPTCHILYLNSSSFSDKHYDPRIYSTIISPLRKAGPPLIFFGIPFTQECFIMAQKF